MSASIDAPANNIRFARNLLCMTSPLGVAARGARRPQPPKRPYRERHFARMARRSRNVNEDRCGAAKCQNPATATFLGLAGAGFAWGLD
jgi:hypothetical protein